MMALDEHTGIPAERACEVELSVQVTAVVMGEFMAPDELTDVIQRNMNQVIRAVATTINRAEPLAGGVQIGRAQDGRRLAYLDRIASARVYGVHTVRLEHGDEDGER